MKYDLCGKGKPGPCKDGEAPVGDDVKKKPGYVQKVARRVAMAAGLAAAPYAVKAARIRGVKLPRWKLKRAKKAHFKMSERAFFEANKASAALKGKKHATMLDGSFFEDRIPIRTAAGPGSKKLLDAIAKNGPKLDAVGKAAVGKIGAGRSIGSARGVAHLAKVVAMHAHAGGNQSAMLSAHRLARISKTMKMLEDAVESRSLRSKINRLRPLKVVPMQKLITRSLANTPSGRRYDLCGKGHPGRCRKGQSPMTEEQRRQSETTTAKVKEEAKSWMPGKKIVAGAALVAIASHPAAAKKAMTSGLKNVNKIAAAAAKAGTNKIPTATRVLFKTKTAAASKLLKMAYRSGNHKLVSLSAAHLRDVSGLARDTGTFMKHKPLKSLGQLGSKLAKHLSAVARGMKTAEALGEALGNPAAAGVKAAQASLKAAQRSGNKKAIAASQASLKTAKEALKLALAGAKQTGKAAKKGGKAAGRSVKKSSAATKAGLAAGAAVTAKELAKGKSGPPKKPVLSKKSGGNVKFGEKTIIQ